MSNAKQMHKKPLPYCGQRYANGCYLPYCNHGDLGMVSKSCNALSLIVGNKWHPTNDFKLQNSWLKARQQTFCSNFAKLDISCIDLPVDLKKMT